MAQKIKVLMLGWEFPPLLTGGLGIACYGLSKALSAYVDLTVILPRSDPDFKIHGFNLLGLNQIDKEEILLENKQADYRLFSNVNEVWMDLDPYPNFSPVPISMSDPTPAAAPFNSFQKANSETNLFNDPDLYGPDIMHKVAVYTDMVEAISKNTAFDVIHAHDWITYAAGIRLKKITHKPLIVHVHSLETDRAGHEARNQVYDIEKTAMIAADRVLPVSNFTKQNIITHYQIDPSKIVTIYNGVDPVKKYKTKKNHPEKWILFLGRVTRQKGPFMILETAIKLIKRMPHVKFYVAGAGDQLGMLKEAVGKHRLERNFVFTGFLSKKDVATLLSKTDVYFMPSISEPFGLSAVEAAQFDIPCVLSKQSGVAELLSNSLQGDFWDTEKFSDLLFAVLNFEGVRKTVVENTRHDLKKIKWTDAAERVFHQYQTLLN